MARIPTINAPTVAPSNDRQPYGRSSAGPEAFGGQEARAFSGLGQQLQQSGQQLGAMVLDQQDQENRAVATDTTVKGDQVLGNLAAQYGSLKGQAAVEAFPQYQKDLAAAREDLLGSLTNPAQKRMASEYLDRRMASYGMAGVEHRIQQQQVWSVNSSKAAAEQSVNNAVASGGNLAQIETSIRGGEQEADRVARLQGGGDLEASVARQSYRGQAYRTVIEGIAQTDPLRAKALFDSVASTMDGPSAVATGAYLKPKVIDAQADAVVNDVYGGGDYFSKIRGAESGSDDKAVNQTTKATGRYQFLASTWKDMANRHPELGLTAEGRTDPAQQQKAIKVFTEENKSALRAGTGREPSDADTYLAHFLGAGDAVKVLNADPSTPVAGLVDPDSIAANKSVLAGKTAGEVQAWAQRKMGGNAPRPTSDEMFTEVARATAGDPDLQRVAISRMASRINIEEAATATARVQLNKDVKELGTAAENGHQIVIPEDRIRALIPDKADEVIGTLQAQQATGDIVQGLQFATPDQIETTRAGIKDGTSPFSAAIEGRAVPLYTVGTDNAGLLEQGNINLSARPTVKNADGSISTVRSMSFEEDGQEVLVPTVAADGSRILSDDEAIEQYRKTGQFLGKFSSPDAADAYAEKLHQQQERAYVPGTPDAEGLNRRDAVLKSYDEAVKRRQAAIKADPATYAITDPTVRGAAVALGQNPGPDTWAKYATATQSLQERLGVPASERAVLPGPKRLQMLGTIATMDPKTVADYMARQQAEMGPDVWPEAFADLQRGPGGLPSEFVALGLMRDYGARTVLTNVLQQEMEKPGSARGLLPDGTAKAVDQQIEEGMIDLLATFSEAAGGQLQGAALMRSAKLLAYGFAGRGQNDSTASQNALEALTGQFDAVISDGVGSRFNARTPPGEGPTMRRAAGILRRTLTPDELFVPPDLSGAYDKGNVARAVMDNVMTGTWVTSPSADGWTLRGGDGNPVRRRDGSMVTLGYDDAQSIIRSDIAPGPSAAALATDPSTGITEDQAGRNAEMRAEQQRRLQEGE